MDLAIVDGILAIMMIALFYTSDVSWGALAVGGVFLIALVAANLAGVSKPQPYALLGVGLWLCFLQSGVHATLGWARSRRTAREAARQHAEPGNRCWVIESGWDPAGFRPRLWYSNNAVEDLGFMVTEAPPSTRGAAFLLRWSPRKKKGGLQHMAQGTVKWFNDDKGYGFISPDEGGEDLFVHHSGIAGSGFKSLEEGAKVSYEASRGQKGMQADNVSLA